MNKLIVFACVCVAAAAAAAGAPRLDAAAAAAAAAAARRALPALQHEELRDALGQYALRYVTAEGAVVSERGRLVDLPTGERVMVYEGETSWTGPDGHQYTTKYQAGPDGVKVEGDHLPKAPVA